MSFYSNHTGLMHSTSFWSSLNYLSAHIISLSGPHDFREGSEQYTWLERDLQKANTEREREIRPWIILTVHYPLYATLDDCWCNYTDSNVIPWGGCFSPPGQGSNPFLGILEVTGDVMRKVLEPLILKYNVDLVITGHEHAYERTYPVRNRTVTDSSSLHVYNSPKSPIHVMIGTGGADPDSKFQPKEQYPWSASRSGDDPEVDMAPWGWLQVDVNRTSIVAKYKRVKERDGDEVFDWFQINK